MIERFCSFASGSWPFLGNFGLWGLIGAFLSLIFWVGLIAGLALLVVRAARRARMPGGQEDEAREILQERYARGEITREQYQQMRQDIA